MSGLPEHIRAFVAVRIPETTRAQLADVQRQLKPELRDVSWTRPDAMHLTLQFLGDIESARVPELKSALRAVARDYSPFELELGVAGSFGNRVIWIGLQRGEEALNDLANAVRRAIASFSGHEENREFSAHVTLGRLRRPTRGASAALRKVSPPMFQPWIVSDFELIRSELSPRGSRYTEMGVFALATVP